MLFSFENCVLDSERRELRRGADIVPLEPQVFDLLLFLVNNRDRVVSKDDLFASVWGGRIVSESALSTRINAVRTAIGDSGDAQRLLRTLPRRGFRFVGEVTEDVSPLGQAANAPSSAVAAAPVAAPTPTEPVSQSLARSSHRRWIIPISIGVVAAVVATVILVPLMQRTSVAGRGERFDPALIPLLDSAEREALADYSRRSDYKALAISAAGPGAADSAPDIETAKAVALQKCALKRESVCTLYAVGMDVVWPHGIVPALRREDQRAEPLSSKYTADELAPISHNETSLRLLKNYSALDDHRALAISSKNFVSISRRASRDEAARLAIERCGYHGQLPCLLVSVDGFWTVEISATRRLSSLFLPTIAAELSGEERQRIGGIYRGQPWRALVRGRKGTWHAVAGAPSEAAAVENALEECGKVDSECQLFAIGNFRVAHD